VSIVNEAPGANIINYELFYVNYDAQLLREEFMVNLRINSQIYMSLCYEIMSVNIDNIGPRVNMQRLFLIIDYI
jgi:hypothetical protein